MSLEYLALYKMLCIHQWGKSWSIGIWKVCKKKIKSGNVLHMVFENFDFVKIMCIQMMIAVYKSSSSKSKYMYVYSQSFYDIVIYIPIYWLYMCHNSISHIDINFDINAEDISLM